MSLAVLISCLLLCRTPAYRSSEVRSTGQDAAPTQSGASPQSQADNGSQQKASPPESQGSAPAQPPASTTASKPAQSPANKPAAKRPVHRKKTAPTNCDTATGTQAGNKPAHDSASNPPAPGAANAPGNCPPQRMVIRQGGTSEPDIQLTGGGSADEAQRVSTDELLGSTRANLKNIEGRTLSQNQQEIVNQIRQFIKESEAAVTAGDIERGHNLAVKAHLLSDELVKPQ